MTGRWDRCFDHLRPASARRTTLAHGGEKSPHTIRDHHQLSARYLHHASADGDGAAAPASYQTKLRRSCSKAIPTASASAESLAVPRRVRQTCGRAGRNRTCSERLPCSRPARSPPRGVRDNRARRAHRSRRRTGVARAPAGHRWRSRTGLIWHPAEPAVSRQANRAADFRRRACPPESL